METATSLRAPVSTDLHAPMSTEQGATCPMCHGSGLPQQGWLAKRRGWVLLGSTAVAGTGLALGEGWVTVAGLAPLLYALPCAAMMAMCMWGMNRGTQATQDQTSSGPPPAAAGDAQRLTPEPEKQA